MNYLYFYYPRGTAPTREQVKLMSEISCLQKEVTYLNELSNFYCIDPLIL